MFKNRVSPDSKFPGDFAMTGTWLYDILFVLKMLKCYSVDLLIVSGQPWWVVQGGIFITCLLVFEDYNLRIWFSLPSTQFFVNKEFSFKFGYLSQLQHTFMKFSNGNRKTDVRRIFFCLPQAIQGSVVFSRFKNCKPFTNKHEQFWAREYIWNVIIYELPAKDILHDKSSIVKNPT